MTLEFLDEKIKEFRETTRQLKKANPHINHVNWHIEEIPYAIFEAWRERYNANRGNYISELTATQVCGKLFYSPSDSVDGTWITFFSKKVKLKTIYEVTEEIDELETV